MPFTKENAAECARLSHAPTSARFLRRDDQEPARIAPISCTNDLHDDAESFRGKATLRVREHIERLQERIDDLLDRRDLDVKAMRDLADAVLKLEQIEQKLSGRAGPGNLRPIAQQKPMRRASVPYPEPIPIEAETTPSSIDQTPGQAISGDWATMLF